MDYFISKCSFINYLVIIYPFSLVINFQVEIDIIVCLNKVFDIESVLKFGDISVFQQVVVPSYKGIRTSYAS